MKKRFWKHKSKFISGISVMSLGGVLLCSAGCATDEPTVVVPVAPPVNIIDATLSHQPLALQNCQFRGSVIVKTVDRFDHSRLNVTETEMHELQNKAADLGGNSVVIRHNQVFHFQNRYVHTINADAYYCNPAVVTH